MKYRVTTGQRGYRIAVYEVEAQDREEAIIATWSVEPISTSPETWQDHDEVMYIEEVDDGLQD